MGTHVRTPKALAHGPPTVVVCRVASRPGCRLETLPSHHHSQLETPMTPAAICTKYRHQIEKQLKDTESPCARELLGPALRSAAVVLSAENIETEIDLLLRNWKVAHPVELAHASALCEAACEIQARKYWPNASNQPWPGARDMVRSLYRSAEKLAPGILAADQRQTAGLKDTP